MAMQVYKLKAKKKKKNSTEAECLQRNFFPLSSKRFLQK